MKPSTLLKAAVAAFVVSMVGDYVWHDMVMHDFYTSRLDAINGGPASTAFPVSLFAIEFIASVGTAYFVLKIAKTMAQAIWNGAFLGFLMVGVLNFVNHSLILQWDTTLLIVDTLWGVALGAIGGAVVWMVAGKK